MGHAEDYLDDRMEEEAARGSGGVLDPEQEEAANGDREECTCPHLQLGTRTLPQRNLSPDCPVHGEEHDRQADKLFGRRKCD